MRIVHMPPERTETNLKYTYYTCDTCDAVLEVTEADIIDRSWDYNWGEETGYVYCPIDDCNGWSEFVRKGRNKAWKYNRQGR